MGKITVIGGVNLDIGGVPHSKIIMNDSNLGKITYSFGGVGRNIAHNLTFLGQSVSLVSALSDDMFGIDIKRSLTDIGVDISHSFTFDCPTSTYLFVADGAGDMLTAVNDMSIYDLLTPEVIFSAMEYINSSEYIVLDTNIRKDTLECVLKNATAPCVVDGVSTVKARKILDSLDKIDTLKVNKYEAEELSGVTIYGKEDVEKSVSVLLQKGLKCCVVSLGKEGAYIADKEGGLFLPAIKTEVVNPTGAGDAMLAGIVYGKVKGFSKEKILRAGIASSSVAIQAESTVNEDMSEEKIEGLL